MKTRWTPSATRDVEDAFAYIALDSPKAAAGQVARMLAAVEALGRFPDLGRRGRVEGTRELVIKDTPFVVSYRIGAEAIEILRVFHGRQSWPDQF